ncbi:MAG: hypothetical protein ACRCSN_09300 [Dermatophilaceae bacterium]
MKSWAPAAENRFLNLSMNSDGGFTMWKRNLAAASVFLGVVGLTAVAPATSAQAASPTYLCKIVVNGGDYCSGTVYYDETKCETERDRKNNNPSLSGRGEGRWYCTDFK